MLVFLSSKYFFIFVSTVSLAWPNSGNFLEISLSKNLLNASSYSVTEEALLTSGISCFQLSTSAINNLPLSASLSPLFISSVITFLISSQNPFIPLAKSSAFSRAITSAIKECRGLFGLSFMSLYNS